MSPAQCLFTLPPDVRHLYAGFNTSDEFAAAERFDEVLVSAGTEAFNPAFLTGACRQQNDRYSLEVRISAHFPQQLKAVYHGHHNVAQDYFGHAPPRCLQQSSSIAES